MINDSLSLSILHAYYNINLDEIHVFIVNDLY